MASGRLSRATERSRARCRQRQLRQHDDHRERREREYPERPDQRHGYQSQRQHGSERRQHVAELGANQDAGPVALVEGREGEPREQEVDGVHHQARREQRRHRRDHRRRGSELKHPVSGEDREREAAHGRDVTRRAGAVLADHETAERVGNDPHEERGQGAGDHERHQRQHDAGIEIGQRPRRSHRLQSSLGEEGDRGDLRRAPRAAPAGPRSPAARAPRTGRSPGAAGPRFAATARRPLPGLAPVGANVSMSLPCCLASVRAHLNAHLTAQPYPIGWRWVGTWTDVLALVAAEAHPWSPRASSFDAPSRRELLKAY